MRGESKLKNYSIGVRKVSKTAKLQGLPRSGVAIERNNSDRLPNQVSTGESLSQDWASERF